MPRLLLSLVRPDCSLPWCLTWACVLFCFVLFVCLLLLVVFARACSLGLSFDCSTGWELKRALAAGIPPQSLCLRCVMYDTVVQKLVQKNGIRHAGSASGQKTFFFLVFLCFFFCFFMALPAPYCTSSAVDGVWGQGFIGPVCLGFIVAFGFCFSWHTGFSIPSSPTLASGFVFSPSSDLCSVPLISPAFHRVVPYVALNILPVELLLCS